MRINAYLAQQMGISRRQADRLLAQSLVEINGKPAALGVQIDPTQDLVKVQGKPIVHRSIIPRVIAVYKPRGYVTTRSDPEGRRTVMDLLPAELRDLKPVGRLDYDSEGLLLFSNDGKFIYETTHPKHMSQKQYRIRFENPVTPDLVRQFLEGVHLVEGVAAANRLHQIGPREIEVVIHQGWNRQLRRMSEACGNKITRLIRTRVGDLDLGELKPGYWREVSIGRT